MNHLKKLGISTVINYQPVHLLKYYKEKYGFKEGDFPVAEDIGHKTITLPLYPKLNSDEINYIIKTVIKIVNLW